MSKEKENENDIAEDSTGSPGRDTGMSTGISVSAGMGAGAMPSGVQGRPGQQRKAGCERRWAISFSIQGRYKM